MERFIKLSGRFFGDFTASFTASFNQFTGSFQYIWFLTMADKTIFSDCLNKINTVVKTHIPLVYLSILHKKTLSFLKGFLVDNSIEISNMSFTPVEFLEVNKSIQLII